MESDPTANVSPPGQAGYADVQPGTPPSPYYPAPPYQQQNYHQQPQRKLYRSTTDKWIGGVCGGLAHHMGMDATVIRLLWVILTVFTAGVGILLYLLLWALVPKESVRTVWYPPQPPHVPGTVVHHHYHQ